MADLPVDTTMPDRLVDRVQALADRVPGPQQAALRQLIAQAKQLDREMDALDDRLAQVTALHAETHQRGEELIRQVERLGNPA